MHRPFAFPPAGLVLAALVLVAPFVLHCQSSTMPDAPPDAAPSFDEPFRPQFHYTPPRHWMNDPNGLVYHEGTYHLFHQYNPEGNTWGHMSWYHATSRDLVHWTHRGVAIPEEGNEMIFSGSAVVDSHNTAGFGSQSDDSPIVAIYTSNYFLPGDSINQAQSLAYSPNGGATWTKYEGNPVLDHPDAEFRDPNVFWYAPEQKWVMAVALSEQRIIQFYESPDLKTWTHLSDFGPVGSTEGIWECPALFRVPVEGTDRTRWVLSVDVGSGGVAGGSGSQYFLGVFDGTTFAPDAAHLDDAPHWADYGPDFYAAIPWNNLPASDGRALWLGWMNNWTYAEDIPTAPWRSAQTVPRSLSLRDRNGRLQLVQHPVEELHALRTDPVRLGTRTIEETVIPLADSGLSGRTLELRATFVPEDAEAVGLHVHAGADEQTRIGFDARTDSVFVDRTRSGAVDFQADFAARNTAPLTPTDGRVTLHVLVDRSSVEVFANGGTRVLTHRLFPDPASDGVALFAQGGSATLLSLDAWTLRSAWGNQ
jgi:fructan beta-fructosidase